MAGTVNLHRVFTAPVERVYRGFTDPEALVKWMAPHGFTAKVHQMDLRVGGGYKMSFTNFTTKSVQSFGGTYTEIKPNQLLKYIDKFDDPNMPGEMKMTISFREVIGGTEVKITQEGIPDMIPVEMCYVGWQQSLHLLAHVVEPTIPDGN
ncbi:SRPBCC family protein [Bdellovibrio sp. HCB2-146]|uniref:SRPBCC family protein n=1 Tax=Bdellovibrio sp. HCB2-146 TaxID=3394362 RepID=UPI0039BD5BB4